jgi:hypothetical protein
MQSILYGENRIWYSIYKQHIIFGDLHRQLGFDEKIELWLS